MTTNYGVLSDTHEKSSQVEVWSGPFYGTWEASAQVRHGAKSATFTDYSDEKFRVTLPEGFTFPRTEDNYRTIDATISDAYAAHVASQGRITIGENA